MLRLFVVVIAFICCEAVPTYGGPGLSSGVASFAPILKGGLASLSNYINTPIGSSYGLANYGPDRVGLSGLGGGLGSGLGGGPVLADGLGAVAAGPLVAGPQVIDVAGVDEPVQVIFRSLGARVHVQQVHTPSGPPQIEEHRTEDEPHRVLHEIVRPVIQEVHEIIQPYRRLTQEIRPVLEEVHTIIAKSDHGANGLVGAGLAGGAVAAGLGHGGYSSSSRKA